MSSEQRQQGLAAKPADKKGKQVLKKLISKPRKPKEIVYGNVEAVLAERVRQKLRISHLRVRDKDHVGWTLGEVAYYIYLKLSQQADAKLDFTELAQSLAATQHPPPSRSSILHSACNMQAATAEHGLRGLVQSFIAEGMTGVVVPTPGLTPASGQAARASQPSHASNAPQNSTPSSSQHLALPGRIQSNGPQAAPGHSTPTDIDKKIAFQATSMAQRPAIEVRLRQHLLNHDNSKLKQYSLSEGLGWTLLELTCYCVAVAKMGAQLDFFKAANFVACTIHKQKDPDPAVLAKVANTMLEAYSKYKLEEFVSSIAEANTVRMPAAVAKQIQKCKPDNAATNRTGTGKKADAKVVTSSAPGSLRSLLVPAPKKQAANARTLKMLEPKLRKHLKAQGCSKIMTYNATDGCGWSLLDLAAVEYAHMSQGKPKPAFFQVAQEVSRRKYNKPLDRLALSKVSDAMADAYRKYKLADFVAQHAGKALKRKAAAGGNQAAAGGDES